jgi:hypothetical protein
LKNSDSSLHTAATYTLRLLVTLHLSVASGLLASANSIGITTRQFGSRFYTNASMGWNATYNFSSLTIVPPATSASTNSIPTWLWSTERNIGIAYQNEKGVTNGILYNGKVSFPAYAENGSQIPLLPYINTKIYHVPPDWAIAIIFILQKNQPYHFSGTQLM